MYAVMFARRAIKINRDCTHRIWTRFWGRRRSCTSASADRQM